jgi:dolichyl-phosphate-mannose-protein mannosyltransferase
LTFFLDFNPRHNGYDRFFLYLLIGNLFLRLLWLDKPIDGLIFDEVYYVNAARNIIHLPHDTTVYPDAIPGTDPNHEHPFLGKGIIALSMLILGDNAWGWRIPSIIFGTIALFIFYLFAKRLTGRSQFALFASFLYAFSNLLFVHSRIATIDIFMLTFMILGFYLYTIGKKYLSAFSLALATLSKVVGLYGFLTIVVFHIVITIIKARNNSQRVSWNNVLSWIEKYAIIYIMTCVILLTIFDRIWVGYENPVDHMIFIYNYFASLTRPIPEGIESYPWQWLLNEVKIPYIRVDVEVYENTQLISSKPAIYFLGAMNPFILYLTIPAIVYCIYSAFKKQEKVAVFAVTWFVMTYLTFYPMSIIGHRIMYLFYFLPTLPSLCLAISHLFLATRPHRIILLIYIVTVLFGFFMLFPFKTI